MPKTCLPTSVWPVAQRPAPTQRRNRYLPASSAHPAKMLPAIAKAAIEAYTSPGDIVCDPMCGVGTTLVEAIHLGREAVGIEYEPRWADIALAEIKGVGLLSSPDLWAIGQEIWWPGSARIQRS